MKKYVFYISLFLCLGITIIFQGRANAETFKNNDKIIVNKETAYQAELSFIDGKVKLNTQKRVIHLDEVFVDEKNNSRYLLQDINLDGYMDIAILTSMGYSWVNSYYTVYFTQNNNYKKFKDDLSNFKVDKTNRQVLAEYKSGPRHFNDIYHISDDNVVSKFASYEHYSDDDECILNEHHGESVDAIVSCRSLKEYGKKIPVYAKVIKNKTYLYSKGDSIKSTSMYLIKDDVVALKQATYFNNNSRYLITFNGKREITKYINQSDIKVLTNAQQTQTYINEHSISFFNGAKPEILKTNDELVLKQLSSNDYYFNLETVTNNAHICQFEGLAKREKNHIVAKQGDCTIQFHQKNNEVTVKDVEQLCQNQCGMNAFIDGISFKKKSKRDN